MQNRMSLDSDLGVVAWKGIPGQGDRARTYVQRDPKAPAWWQGDEEASQSFFTGMRGGGSR